MVWPETDDFKIREASPEEYQEIYQLVKEAFRHYKKDKPVTGHLKESPGDVKEDIEKNLVLVLLKENKIIGSLRLEKKEEGNFYLKRFAVLPGYQGLGCGSMLFSAAEKKALKRNCCRIYLHASAADKRIRNFYQQLGFKCLRVDKEKGYARGLWVKKLTKEMKGD